MLCHHCWIDTWEGTHCKECGRRLSTQKSFKLRLMYRRDAIVTRRRVYLFGAGLVVALVGAPGLGEATPYVAAFSGILLGWLLSLCGALQAYEECYSDFWETYGGGSRALGPIAQPLVALLRRDGLTNFMILEGVLIVCEDGEDCRTCKSDCEGKQAGKSGNSFCCGDGQLAPAEGDGTICHGNP